jgi:hypothetical protein
VGALLPELPQLLQPRATQQLRPMYRSQRQQHLVPNLYALLHLYNLLLLIHPAASLQAPAIC